jgi:hypothetical protein
LKRVRGRGRGDELGHAETFWILERVAVLALTAIIIVVLDAIQETTQHIRALNKGGKKARFVTGTLLVGTAFVQSAEQEGEVSSWSRSAGRRAASWNTEERAPPVDVRIDRFAICVFKPQKIAQASLIPWIHYHEHIIADVRAIPSGLVITERN